MMFSVDRLRTVSACVFVALLIAATAARSEPSFSLETTPGRLPKTIVPVHYALDLKPDLEKLSIAGTAVITVEVREPTEQLLLNALNIEFASAAIDGIAASNISADAQAQTAKLTFAQPVAVGQHTLRIDYKAQINKFGRGVFVVEYPTADGRKKMLSSHMEPTDARRVFPGWDEPAFKATFELTITVPEQFLAVSNMPIVRETPLDGGLKRVSFPPTPRMSSYLFVFAAGDLERSTLRAEDVDIGVVTTRGKSGNGRYALEQTAALLKFYNDYFGVKYPLPKLDLIAVPGGFGGAMENWGGITFFESRVLFDPAKNSPDAQRGIFSIIAHEVAHQWFGNLVTTGWWDNIWLNEGFASWMQAKAAENLHPDWQTWAGYSGAKQAAMTEDARRTARAIQQPVANETEAMAVFDVITYSKGAALVRMIENYLGEDAFRDGIRGYMREHAYSNATTADLWRALGTASGKPVASIASSYTEQPGVPLVVAEARCQGGQQRIILRQDRFSVRDPSAKPQQWQIPMRFGRINGARAGDTILLDRSAEFAAGACGEPVKLNLGDVGYYRVRYDGAMQSALARVLPTLASLDRVNLLADTWALVESGRSAPAAYFELADQLGGDDNRTVVEQVIRTLARIDQLERGQPGRAAFRAFARSALRPTFDRLGWQATAGESNDRVLLRARLIRVLGDLGDEAIIAEAKHRFAAFLADPESLPPSLREPVTHLVGRTADRAMYDTLLGLARQTTNTDERSRYYSALASSSDPALARDTLGLSLTDELPNSLIGTLISWVAVQGEHPELALDFVLANFEALVGKQSPSFRNTFVSNLMGNFSDPARAEQLKNFAPAYANSGGRMVAERTIERILVAAEFIAQQLPAVDAWIRRRSPLP